jgi:hypothetical protein
MADIEITDEASLEAWLKTRPRRDAEIIAFRAAARVFPLWGRAMEEEWVLPSGIDADEGQLSAIDCARMLLTALSLKGARDQHVKRSFGSAVDTFVSLSFREVPKSGIESAFRFAQCVYANEIPKALTSDEINDDLALRKAVETLGSALQATAELYSVEDIWDFDDVWSMDELSKALFSRQVSLDCEKLMLAEKIDNSPLWPKPAPKWFTKADGETRAIWAKDPATWAFWEKWWDGVTSGDMPFSPELLRDVALIEDYIWQAGPKAVAERINLLIQRNALQREAAAINARLMEFIAFNEGLGANLHNQPPEDELSPVKLRATLGEILQALKEIEVALDGPEILPEVVAGLGQRLKDLWDGFSAKVKVGIVGLTFVATSISQGFLGSVGDDIHELVKRNIDIPSFSRRLLDFGKELEKPRNPAPVFPPRPPVDL